ncbi:MAG: DUF3108 domain-containing protein [Acidobacteriia bacterium]|nr:DUF3108 domain-containing protein [Terriglobia bacterium]
MNPFVRSPLLAAAAFVCVATAGAQTGFPFQNETLRYTLNWPSGLSLGDAGLTAQRSSSGWDLDLTLDAGIPGFAIADHYHSAINAGGCSLEFDRNTSHAVKKADEKTTFDYPNGLAHRVTLGAGGASDLPISSCAHDALAFVYYARRELGQGRVPPPQQLFFGSAYSVRLDYTGAQTIQVGEAATLTDCVVVYLKGPASDVHFQMFFARDAARTPLSIRVPTSLGTLSLDLVR